MSAITLNQYLVQAKVPAQLQQLLTQMSVACKAISVAISKGALAGVLGQAGSDNIQGEEQKKLDVISNDIVLDAGITFGQYCRFSLRRNG
jgi:fructose-1,6-bisphosphatase I